MSSYRIGTITGSQAGLSVTALIQEVEWATSVTEVNRQTAAGDIYASDLINPRAEVKIRAVVPREYANIPAAGGSITVNGCSFGAGSMSLNMDGTSGQSFQISGSRVVASNESTATLEITGYAYLEAPGSASFDWILTDEQYGDEYRADLKVVWDGTKLVYVDTSYRRTTSTMTWRKMIGANEAAPHAPNPGGLSPTGWSQSTGRANRWVCLDSGASRPYLLNGEIVKEARVTWQMVSSWEAYTPEDSSSSS